MKKEGNETKLMMNIPEVTASPAEISQISTVLMDRSRGIVAKKLTRFGTDVKTFFVDHLGTRIFYTPSSKSFTHASISLKNVVELGTDTQSTPILRKTREIGFPLILRTSSRELLLLIHTEKERDALLQTLSFLIRKTREAEGEEFQKLQLYDLWMTADKNGDNVVMLDELELLLKELNILMPQTEVERLFQKFDENVSGTLSFKEFAAFIEHLSTVSQLRPLFDRFERANNINKEGLKKFFLDVQGEDLSDDLLKKMISAYSTSRNCECLSFREFQVFLRDTEENSWFNPGIKATSQDMSRPLSDFMIASQFVSHAEKNEGAATIFRKSLLGGCRNFEISCVDGVHEEPAASFGFMKETLPLREIINLVDEYGFRKSPFPIILSLNVQTSDSQSSAVAKMLRSSLGSKLFSIGDAPSTSDDFSWLNPSYLQNKVLVSLESSTTSQGKGISELKRTVCFSEGGPLQIKTSSSQADLTRLDQTATVLQRVIPTAGKEVNIFGAWSSCAQFASVNFQHWDSTMHKYHGWFLQNGSCGYVLKPEDMGCSGGQSSLRLEVTIICGFQLPKVRGKVTDDDIIDPFVSAEISGLPEDTANNSSFSTHHVEDNGYSPFWNVSTVFTLKNINLSMLTLRVKDHQHDGDARLVAEASIPLNALRLGYRAVPLLYCHDGEIVEGAGLFCHFALL